MTSMAGANVLYVVATPIGNLEDITKRARRILAEVDFVAAEDTRRTRKLLTHLGISKPLISYYEPKEEKAIPEIIALLEQGKSVALVTDGGTPAVSDPGYRLVRAALEAGIKVTPVPGPSALAAAMSAAGMPTDLVTFAGFLPPKKTARRAALQSLATRPDTIILYESPKRIADLLGDALDILGDREAVIFREITKIHEEQIRGTISRTIELLKDKEIKGEITVLIRGSSRTIKEFPENELKELIREALQSGDRPLSQLASDLARQTGWPRKKIYEMALELNKSR